MIAAVLSVALGGPGTARTVAFDSTEQAKAAMCAVRKLDYLILDDPTEESTPAQIEAAQAWYDDRKRRLPKFRELLR